MLDVRLVARVWRPSLSVLAVCEAFIYCNYVISNGVTVSGILRRSEFVHLTPSQLASGEVQVVLNEVQYLGQQIDMAEQGESDADLTDVELDSGISL